jgi:hypothetical protein
LSRRSKKRADRLLVLIRLPDPADTAPMTSLWRELASASWLANTGIPLFLTVGAIMAGFWTMRRQMQHDRMLLIAQNRAQAARSFGAAVLRELDKFKGGLGDDSPVGRQKSFDNEAGIISGAMREAGGVLGELPGWDQFSEEVSRATGMVSHVWRYAAKRRRAAGDRSGFDDADMNEVMGLVLYPFIQHVRRIAQSLSRWDGIGSLPAGPAWTSQMPNTGVDGTSRHYPNGFWTGEHYWDYANGEPRELDPAWYADLDASWRSCLECWRDVLGRRRNVFVDSDM